MEVTPAAYVVLPLAAVALLRRRWTLAFLVATAPFFSLTVVTAFSHEFHPGEIVLIGLIGRQIGSWLHKQRVILHAKDTFKWLILFGIVSILSVMYAAIHPTEVPVHPYNIGAFGAFVFEPLTFSTDNVTQLVLRLFFVVGVFSIADAIEDEVEIRRLLRWLVMTGVLVGIIGVAYQLSILVDLRVAGPLRWIGFQRFVTTPQQLGPLPRMYSLPGEPGFTGDYLLYTLAIAGTGFLATERDEFFTRREMIIIPTILVISLLLSTGTTAYGGILILSVVLSAVTVSFVQLNTTRFKRILAAGVAAIPLGLSVDAILLDWTVLQLIGYEIQKLTFSTASGSIRLRYMVRTLDIIQTRPLLGAGVGSHHVPSMLFTIAAETGLIGLIVFAALHITLYRHCGWLAYQNHPRYGTLALLLFVAGVTLILTNLIAKSIATLLLPWYWFSIAFPLALIMTWRTDAENENVDT